MGDIRRYHRQSSLNNSHLFLTVLEAGKSNIKVATDLVPGEAPFPELQMAAFLLYRHMKKRGRSGVSSYSFLNYYLIYWGDIA